MDWCHLSLLPHLAYHLRRYQGPYLNLNNHLHQLTPLLGYSDKYHCHRSPHHYRRLGLHCLQCHLHHYLYPHSDPSGNHQLYLEYHPHHHPDRLSLECRRYPYLSDFLNNRLHPLKLLLGYSDKYHYRRSPHHYRRLGLMHLESHLRRYQGPYLNLNNHLRPLPPLLGYSDKYHCHRSHHHYRRLGLHCLQCHLHHYLYPHSDPSGNHQLYLEYHPHHHPDRLSLECRRYPYLSDFLNNRLHLLKLLLGYSDKYHYRRSHHHYHRLGLLHLGSHRYLCLAG